MAKNTLFAVYPDYFVNNDFALKYYNLINDSCSITGSSYTELHHVIPVCFYKLLYNCKTRRIAEKFADMDSINYKVQLSFPDHVLAHYYLCKFCKDDVLLARLKCAFLQLIHFANSFMEVDKLPESEILAAAEKEFRQSSINCFGKKVLCIENGAVFNSIALANEFVGKDRYKYLGISNVCCNRDNQQTACGYHWCFADDIDRCNMLSKLYFNQQKVTPINSSKPVICIETNEIFTSASKAAKKYNVSRSRLLLCCQKSWLTVDDKHFCLLANLSTFKIIPKPKLSEAQKLNISIKTKEAMQKIPADKRKAMNEKAANFWKINNLHYYNNGFEEIRASSCPSGWVAGRLPKYKPKGMMIECVELSKVFNSQTEAATALGISAKSISNAIHKKAKTAGGYSWRIKDM